MLQSFFHNVTIIISFVFLGIRLQNIIIFHKNGERNFLWMLPVFTGILSILIMLEPFYYNSMVFDLRMVPIFVISYKYGWEAGMLSTFLPAMFRMFIGGTTVWQGIAIGLWLPALIGGFFYRQDGQIMSVHRVIKCFVVCKFSEMVFQYLTMDMSLSFWLQLSVAQIIFSTFAVFCIALIIKDADKAFLMQRELEHRASHDTLTGLRNLSSFHEEVDQLIEHFVPVVILMVDVDYFKEYNDTHGHLAGDLTLRGVGEVLRTSVREEDIVARYGGEEFIICLPGIVHRPDALAIAEQIRKNVEEHPFVGRETQPDGRITISVGMSFSGGLRNLDMLILDADRALYQAKINGKNGIMLASNE